MSEATRFLGEVCGNYKIVAVLGEGGMGAIYRAEHILIGKKVALKMLHGEFSEEPEIVDRFFTEAKAVNKIGHQNIIDISDYGHTKDGCPFFIMELLEGRALAKELKNRVPLELGRALHVIEQVADALEASHRAGIIHRDLKPENIFLIRMGGDPDFVKILDFGIAKLVSEHKTHVGILLGTPAYISPEQVEGEEIDQRADIYALGVVLYEMLTGRQPFAALTPDHLIAKLLTEPALPPRTLNPSIPVEVDLLVMRALEKDRKKR